MGSAMAGHLLDDGHSLTVFTRSRHKAQSLLDRGAIWANSPRAVAAAADIVLTMVGFPDEVRAVYCGSEGILACPDDSLPRYLVDMTSTAPSLAREIHAAAAARGIAAIDAPVSGGDVGAMNATLSIMVGGDPVAVEEVRPLLALMGKTIIHQGGPGAGQHAKLCNQIVVAGTMIGVCESLVYGQRAGLDATTLLASIAGGAAGCWTLDNLAPRIVERNFAPGFYVEHFIKDLGIALEESRRMGLDLPGLALAHELYERTRTLGHGRDGTHALYLALEQQSA